MLTLKGGRIEAPNQESPFNLDLREATKRDKKSQETREKMGQHSKDWEYNQGVLWNRGRIYVPQEGGLWERILQDHHDTMESGHPGRHRMQELVTHIYWWPRMFQDVKKYIQECDICQRKKIRARQPVGELQTIEVPSAPWTVVSNDFIVELPKSEGNTAVWVVVDLF